MGGVPFSKLKYLVLRYRGQFKASDLNFSSFSHHACNANRLVCHRSFVKIRNLIFCIRLLAFFHCALCVVKCLVYSQPLHSHTIIDVYIYTYIYIYMCVCVLFFTLLKTVVNMYVYR